MTNVTVNEQIYENITFSILPSGYGHWDVRASFFTPSGDLVSHKSRTSDSVLIDGVKSDDEAARERLAEIMVSRWLDTQVD